VQEQGAHRHFTPWDVLRPLFARHRDWLGELCRLAARELEKACRSAAHGSSRRGVSDEL